MASGDTIIMSISPAAKMRTAYRMKDLANRDRTKGQASWAIDVTHELTVTPNGGFLYDDYQTDIEFRTGQRSRFKKVHSWNAGVDVTLNVNRNLALFVSYNYENGYRQVYQQANLPELEIETTDRTNTFMVGAKLR